MTVVGNVAPVNSVDLAGVRATSNNRDDGFARMLDEVSGRERTQNQPRNARNNESQKNNGSAQSRETRPADETRAADTDLKTQESGTTRVDEAANENPQGPALSDKAEEELVEDLACVLQITGEELLVVLYNLQMQPVDLAETKNVTLVISEVLEVESPIELLGMEGVKEMFAEIGEALTTAYEKTAAEPVQIQTEAPIAAALETEGVIYTSNLEEMANLQLAEEENAVFETENQQSNVKVVQTGEQQAQTEANTGEGGNNQNELFQNAEVEVNMMTQPTVETQVSTNTVTLNAETPQAAANREVVDQIFEKIKVDIKPGVSEIKMSLRPESLGEVSLRIASENGIITAHFVAESQRVKEIIESNFNQLKDTLAEQGVNVAELSVSVSTGNSEQHMNEFLKERSKSQGRIANILASLENGELAEVDEQEVYNNTLNIKA
ncbi:MAG: flagellar hook-length control protein FliK [Defluviitaleaceae bacterium]|nr:flagellar hook-length control protein FliK [Defluviitaleaceae bacterium]